MVGTERVRRLSDEGLTYTLESWRFNLQRRSEPLQPLSTVNPFSHSQVEFAATHEEITIRIGADIFALQVGQL